MKYTRVGLLGFGYELPPRVISSSELEERLEPVYRRLKLPAGRLELMTGIKERRCWDKDTRPSHGAALAAAKALTAAGISTNEVECLIFTSVSRDLLEPATASIVHHRLGLPEPCLVFDLSNACLGFLNAMMVLANMIELGQVRRGLIVASETAEELIETTVNSLLSDPRLTRKSIKYTFASLTIGSGAVALVMGNAEDLPTSHRFVGGAFRANTAQSHLCTGGQQQAAGTLMFTDSEELLKRGVETAQATWRDFLAEMVWSPESVDRFFCHQVGRAHAKLLFETLALDPARNFETIARLGNVGSVSAPITMAMGLEQGVVRDGSRVALLGIGSGINCLMLGIDW